MISKDFFAIKVNVFVAMAPFMMELDVVCFDKVLFFKLYTCKKLCSIIALKLTINQTCQIASRSCNEKLGLSCQKGTCQCLNNFYFDGTNCSIIFFFINFHIGVILIKYFSKQIHCLITKSA
jgi:hypothetical protein